MVTPQNALKLSMWLAATHPRAFQAVLSRLQPTQSRGGFGGAPAGGTYIPGSRSRVPLSHARGRFGRMGAFGDDPFSLGLSDTPLDSGGDMATVTVSADAPGFDAPGFSAAIAGNPILHDINTNTDVSAASFDLNGAAAVSDTTGGFWSSLGSGLSSIGGGLASAVGAVAGAIVNPQTLSAVGNLAATVIKANGANAQQQALLQQQIQRTATGAGAHPVIYSTNPTTGQQVPLYYNAATGQYQAAPASTGLFGSLFSPAAPGTSTGLSAYLPVILIGGGLLLAAVYVTRK